MKYRTTPYILEKDGIYYSFPSEKSACEFLGVPKSCVASVARTGNLYYGYRVIKAVSENDIYRNKRLRKIWESMKERCYYTKHIHYKSYGGRGITVCEEWMEYLPFAKWAFRNGYSDNLTIDRINVNGNYEPCNCRWIPMSEQHSNKRTNHYIDVNGEKMTISQCAKKYDIPKSTVRYWANKYNNTLEINDCGAKMEENSCDGDSCPIRYKEANND